MTDKADAERHAKKAAEAKAEIADLELEQRAREKAAKDPNNP